MKSVLPALLLSALLTGCQDDRVTTLEQRVNRLEQTVNQLQSEHTKQNAQESDRSSQLAGCVEQANTDFYERVRLNGTKNSKGYLVPVPVQAQLQHEREAQIEQCKLLYGK